MMRISPEFSVFAKKFILRVFQNASSLNMWYHLSVGQVVEKRFISTPSTHLSSVKALQAYYQSLSITTGRNGLQYD